MKRLYYRCQTLIKSRKVNANIALVIFTLFFFFPFLTIFSAKCCLSLSFCLYLAFRIPNVTSLREKRKDLLTERSFQMFIYRITISPMCPSFSSIVPSCYNNDHDKKQTYMYIQCSAFCAFTNKIKTDSFSSNKLSGCVDLDCQNPRKYIHLYQLQVDNEH